MRMAAAYAAMFVISVGLLFAIVYGVLNDYADSQTRAAVEIESRELAAEGSSDGLAALAELLRTRSAETEAHYLLLSVEGRPVAGDLPQILAKEGWAEVPDTMNDGDDDSGSLVILGTRLLDGALLLVAHETHERDELLDALITAFASAAVLAVIIALGSGYVLSQAFLKRIDSFSETADSVMQGRLSERIPVSGTGDEYDRLAGRFNEMLARIEDLVAGMRQVSSDVAHDLRTPLSRLRQNLELARRDGATVADYKTAVDGAIEETDSILATFAALLRIAQVEAGTRRSGFARLDLSDVFSAIFEAYEASVEDSGRKLISRIEPGVLIWGDRELLVQMLSNLIENAIRHTPKHSIIELNLTQRDGHAIGVVADNGSGIPPEERPKVFQRFYRLERSRSSPGNGLGLALVGAVAELHGIEVDLSDNQPGLRLTLRFPRTPA